MRWVVVAMAVLVVGCGSAPRQVAAPAPALRQVDSFPLYELTDTHATPSLYAATDASGWACTVFAAGGLVGRNFDFHDEPALVLHHQPPGVYKSVSLVDISYLGFDRKHLASIDAEGLAGAARMPFDGMNERGLVVAMAAVPGARTPRRERTTGSLGVMRLALDHAATVGEAVAIFRRTAVDFGDGPPLHYLVADPSGASAVIEYVRGQVHVITSGRWQAMTNFTLTGSTAGERAHDRRYHTAATALASGPVTPETAMELLRAVRQPITRWSAVYDMRARTVRVVMGQKYGRVLTFGVS